MPLSKTPLRVAAKVQVTSPGTTYITTRPFCYQLPISPTRKKSELIPRHSNFLRSAAWMHTPNANPTEKATFQNEQQRAPSSYESINTEENKADNLDSSNTQKNIHSNANNTKVITESQYKDNVPTNQQEDNNPPAKEEGEEEYDEDKEEARIEKLLGFKPKRIRPKGKRTTDTRNIVTDFGSESPKEEDYWRC